jgi:hypothetical protein
VKEVEASHFHDLLRHDVKKILGISGALKVSTPVTSQDVCHLNHCSLSLNFALKLFTHTIFPLFSHTTFNKRDMKRVNRESTSH